MKNLIKNIGILLLTMMSILATAQEVERSYFPPRQAGWWTLGINGGWAFQQSDVSTTLEGYGFGMTLAKNLYYRPSGVVSFDVRGRWLYSQTIGLDTKRGGVEFNSALNGTRAAGEGLDYTVPGYVFQNHKTHQFELGLEGMLTANRLRERTGIIASIYGGINLDWYNPLLDQANSNGKYDYTGISTSDSKSSVKSTLRNNILDGVYETNAHGLEDGAGAIKFMPSLGIELGYQVTPRFSMHVGHKATFAQTDDLDGEVWDNNNNVSAENDVHHYTNLGLQWILNPKENRMDPPVIEVTRPRTNPFISTTRRGQVDAKIKNVRNQADITCLVNGRNSSFSFNKGKFRTNFPLEYGNNEVIITASNQVGTDEEKLIIYYGEPDTPPVVGSGNSGNNYNPKVNITSPRNASHTTENEDITIAATVQYVDSKNDIEFLVNGRRVNEFSYDNRRNEFSGGVRLQEGRNEIEIIGRNESGSARDNVVITYEKKAAQPRVRITTPSRNPYETTQDKISVRADIDNVIRKNDIKYYVNGRERSLFNFDTRNGEFNADVSLENGRNEIRVKAFNEVGDAQDEITIIYKSSSTTTTPPPAGDRPVVTITSVSGSSASDCRTSIKATILNIKRKSEITFKINGRTRTDFSYNTKTKVFSSTVNLDNGNNNISILAKNSVGSHEDSDSKRCESYTPPPSTNKPQVTINTPNNNSTSTTGTTKLNARIKYVNRKQNVRVKLNGNTINDFSFSQISGVVTANLNLQNGNNTISVWGKNNDGTDEESVRVKYNAPSNPPNVDITQPSSNATTDTKTAIVKAKVLNVSGKQDIRFTFNGSNFTNFSYSTSSKILTANVNLKEGSNSITIKATTNDGSDSENVSVTYVAPKVLPTVDISSPNNNSTTVTQIVSVKAKIINVSSKSNVTFTLNGKKVSSFSLSGTNFQGNAKLKEGRNTIIVKGRNNDGNAQDKVLITYTPKVTVAKPVVKFTIPSRAGIKVRRQATTLKATVTNIQQRNQIKVKLNGKNANFNFDSRSKTITIPATLKVGSNKVVITATNEGGTDSAETTLIFNTQPNTRVEKPEVTITSVSTPTTNPFNPGVSGSNITGKVENIINKSQITITHNGNKVTNFTYSTTSKQFQVAIQLVANTTNKVIIKATTRTGSDTKEHTY